MSGTVSRCLSVLSQVSARDNRGLAIQKDGRLLNVKILIGLGDDF